MNPLAPKILGRALPLGLALAVAAGCGGPRERIISDRAYKARPARYPIETYVGAVQQSHREIALIDSTAYSTIDESTKSKQLEELKRRARELGADAIDEIHQLTKDIKGYTIDERTPFPAWRQGDYPLFFLRGRAIIYDSGLPGAVARGEGFTAGPEGYSPTEDEAAKEKRLEQEREKEKKAPKSDLKKKGKKKGEKSKSGL